MDNLEIGRIIYTKFNKVLILNKQDYEDFDKPIICWICEKNI